MALGPERPPSPAIGQGEAWHQAGGSGGLGIQEAFEENLEQRLRPTVQGTWEQGVGKVMASYGVVVKGVGSGARWLAFSPGSGTG